MAAHTKVQKMLLRSCPQSRRKNVCPAAEAMCPAAEADSLEFQHIPQPRALSTEDPVTPSLGH